MQQVAHSRRLWREGYRYAKAGVIFNDLAKLADLPHPLLPAKNPQRSQALMQTLDRINLRHGRGTLRPASVIPTPRWHMRRERLSPRYTTEADEMLKVQSS